MKNVSLFILFFLFPSCSSTPVTETPPWTRGPTRTVDNGYIVYVGTGEAGTLDRATLEAEGIAIGDLANECSFVPKGARIEDRYDTTLEKGGRRVYVKIGLLFEECEGAKKAIEPEDIKKLANVAMAETLKRYQDLTGTAEIPAQESATISNNDEYFVARQRVAGLKQVIILSPTFDREVYFTRIGPATTVVRTYEVANPSLRDTQPTWSSVRHERALVRPAPAPSRGEVTKPVRQQHPPRVKRRRRR